MFEKLLSNSRMKEQLTRAIESGRPMHAYLFCGAEGTGKMTAATLLAQYLVGKNAGKAERGTHPDIFVLEPPKDKKLISVDQVRDMRADAFIKPSEAMRKIYIIRGVELMNDSGQNALLTLLEQPPEYAVFILLAVSREKVLPTVVSRCAVFEMEYVSEDEGVNFLSKELSGIPEEKLRTAMRAAQGNLSLARTFVTSESFAKSENACILLMRSAAVKNAYRIASVMSRPDKAALLEFLPILSMYIRDILVYRTTANKSRLVFADSVLKYSSEFDKITTEKLYNCVMECQRAIEKIQANVNCQLISSALSVELAK